jgi:hypothetical protein
VGGTLFNTNPAVYNSSNPIYADSSGSTPIAVSLTASDIVYAKLIYIAIRSDGTPTINVTFPTAASLISAGAPDSFVLGIRLSARNDTLTTSRTFTFYFAGNTNLTYFQPTLTGTTFNTGTQSNVSSPTNNTGVATTLTNYYFQRTGANTYIVSR